MRSLWSQRSKIKEVLKHRDLILLCDFDGTLAAIAPKPSLAKLPPRTRTALKTLSGKNRVHVAVVSGRPLRQVRRLVRVRNIAYIGSHGYGIALPGQRPQLRLSSEYAQRLRKLAKDLRRTINGLHGPWVEKKVAGVAVHYRQASRPVVRETLERLDAVARRYKRHFKIQRGKMVCEFVPTGRVTKGTTVRELLKRLRGRRRAIVMYFGDDLTDESVFSNLRKRDFGILVGQPRASGARFHLRSPKEVAGFLNWVGGITI